MRINFQINNFLSLNNTRINHNYQNPFLRQIPFDSFEKMNFCAAKAHNQTEQIIGDRFNDFEVKKIKNLRCPVCGLIMLNDEQIEQFTNDIKGKRGYELADTLEKYEDDSIFTGVKENPPKSIFRPQKQIIVDIIKELAKQNPNKTLTDLVNIEATRRIDELIETQLAVIDEMKEYIESHVKKEEREELLAVIDEYEKEIKNKKDSKFTVKTFRHYLLNATKNPNTQRNLDKIIKKFPTSGLDINSWFVKYSNPNKSREIARSLLLQSIPTAEHLQPKSKNGSNGTSNYICDCSYCNKERGDIDFDEWARTIPDFKDKLQKYLQDVQDAIDHGEISNKYELYIEKVIETIQRLSGGEIVLEETKNNLMLAKRDKQTVKAEEGNQVLIRERATLRKKIQKYKNHSYYTNLTLIQRLKDELSEIQQDIKNCRDEQEKIRLERRKKSIEIKIQSCEKYIKDMDSTDIKISSLEGAIYSISVTESRCKKLRAEIQKKEELVKKQSSILYEISAAQTQNAKITAKPNFNPKDTSLYEQYIHLIHLQETAENMLLKYGSKNKKTKNERDVISIGSEAILERMEALLKDDRVLYFYNKKKIENYKISLPLIEKQLGDIAIKEKELQGYERELKIKLGGKTTQELQDELKQLKERKEIIDNIKNLDVLQAELEMLDQTIEYNSGILRELRSNYSTMSSEEFGKLIGSMYLKRK